MRKLNPWNDSRKIFKSNFTEKPRINMGNPESHMLVEVVLRNLNFRPTVFTWSNNINQHMKLANFVDPTRCWQLASGVMGIYITYLVTGIIHESMYNRLHTG
jgi:hypothetical protein